MWKNIHKTALTREKVGENNELNNHPDFAYLYNAATGLQKYLIQIIITGLVLEAITSHFLDILPPDSDFITICNCIHLSLLLNQS